MDYLSKTPNKDLMASARKSLKGFWGLSVGVTVVYFLICAVGYIPVIGSIISILIAGPLTLGLAIFYLSLSRKQSPALPKLFEGFERFAVALGAYFLQIIFIFLWLLLLIVPGIIAMFAYSMTYFILADNDAIGPLEAIRKSKEIMRGNKLKFFYLGCRFIGWILLCALTLGIGFLWLVPYMMTANAKFYDDLVKKQAIDLA